MDIERVADMTLEQLKTLIDQRIQQAMKPHDSRSVQEILDALDRHMWTPPDGSKSSLEQLREDRDA